MWDIVGPERQSPALALHPPTCAETQRFDMAEDIYNAVQDAVHCRIEDAAPLQWKRYKCKPVFDFFECGVCPILLPLGAEVLPAMPELRRRFPTAHWHRLLRC